MTGHVHLTAIGIETDAPEIGAPLLLVNVKRSLFPKRRKRTAKAPTAQAAVGHLRAAGETPARVRYFRDGSFAVELGDTSAQDESAPVNGNPWDEVLNNDDR